MLKARTLVIIMMFATLLKLLGCSGRDYEENKAQLNDTINKSLENFKNRPIHKILTEKIIDETNDEDLIQLIFDNLSQKTSENYEKEYAIVMSMNKPQQTIYMIWLLEAEVNNGGYNQFYFNSSGQFYKHLPEVLNNIGANKFADLTQRANDTFEKENPKITQHQDGTLEGFSKSYDDNPLNKFDTAFYDTYKTEDLQQIQINFIRKNKLSFCN